jgi:hypothetical protein
VIKESTEEFIDQNTKPALEEGGEHHNLIGVGCWDIFSYGRAPLQHYAIWEEVIHDELADLILCHTPFRERRNEASIRVPRMFKSHVRPTIW